jgi:hypothetical protein
MFGRGTLESHLQVCEGYIYLHSPTHTLNLTFKVRGPLAGAAFLLSRIFPSSLHLIRI